MDISKIPTGSNPPAEINAVIEIPQGGVPVKYELDKGSGAVFVDRFLHTAMFYPGNYGFILFFGYLQSQRPDLLKFKASGDRWLIVHGWLAREGKIVRTMPP